jgi:alpha-tubulin suppressor-like RCC1 family protein/phosphodiesterase/alkaline phosphatase D-like protein
MVGRLLLSDVELSSFPIQPGIFMKLLSLLAVLALSPASATAADAVNGLNFQFASATSQPLTVAAFDAAGQTASFELKFAPATGTNLCVVNNTGLDLIQGDFDNLAQGQRVNLAFGGMVYPFVANYYGGTGNDLVLEWGSTRLMAWGSNANGQLGESLLVTSRNVPAVVSGTDGVEGGPLFGIAANEHCFSYGVGSLLVGWGRNDDGRVGNGVTGSAALPGPVVRSGVLAGKTVTGISAGYTHSLAFCPDGTLASWGGNDFGELGRSSTATTTPGQVGATGILNGRKVLAVAAGGNFSLALCDGGVVASWGYNGSGQLGDGSTTKHTAPAWVSTAGVLAGKEVVAIAAGVSHSLALCADGTIAAWGGNSSGQLGDGSSNSSLVPVRVNSAALAVGERPVKVVAGSYHSLALVAMPPPALVETLAATAVGDGAAALNGQVNGNGSAAGVVFEYGLTSAYGSTLAAAPATVTGTTATAVAATAAGLLPGTTYHYRVVATSAGGTVKGQDLTFVTTDAAVLAGLATSAGEVLPEFDPKRMAYTLTVTTATTGISVTPTARHAAATVRVNGTATESGAASQVVPLEAGDTTIVIEVAGAGANTQTYRLVVARLPEAMVFDSATTVPATGANFQPSGMVNLVLNFAPVIGTRLTVIKNTGSGVFERTFANLGQWETVYLPYGGTQYRFVANYFGGDGNDLVLEWGGERLLGWGYNGTGGAGDGTTTDRKLPTPVGGDLLTDKVIVRCAVGGSHNLALCADGTLVAWGRNSEGQLGDGGYTGRTFPVPVDRSGVLAGRTIVALAAGTTSLALCSDGEMAAWGYNFAGAVGDGTTTHRYRPVLVDRSGVLAGKRVMSIMCGSSYSLALCGDGTVAAWGNNDKGQLGDGTTTNRSSPVWVDMSGELKGRTVVAVAAGWAHNLALCADGAVVAWGSNEKGQLGNGASSVSASRPVLVKMVGALVGKTVAAVAAGFTHSLVLCTDGSLVTWGGNYAGELGNGVSGVDSLVPVAVDRNGVLSGKTVSRISNTGSSFNVAVCTDGVLATWGGNNYGQLGDNTTTNRTRPVLPVTTALRAGERWIDASANSAFILGVVASQPATLPVPETLAAENVTRTTATLNGRVNANGLGTRVYFEYGLTTAYGSSAPQTPLTMNGSAAVAVSAALSGLLPDRTYHFRVVATIGSHTLNGADQTFTTNDLAVLTSLSLSAGALQPGFNSDRVSYNVTLPHATTGLTLTAVPKHPDATLRINGEVVASGQPSQELPLAVGNTAVKVLVTGAGGETATYQIEVTRLPASFAFAASNTVPVTAGNFQAGGEAAFALGFTPALGAVLTVVNTTGNNPIAGRFSNLRQWQTVSLAYGGVTYQFVADYFGGTGNDLVLRWGHQRLLMWGANGSGQLGDGTVTNRLTPTAPGLVLGNGRTVVASAIGPVHSLALRSDGVLFAWGDNASGQLGTGDKVASSVPVPVDTEGELAGRTILSLVIGSNTSFALCEDGVLFAWGSGYGVLPGPVAMSGALTGKSIASLAVASSRRLALCTDGTVAEWSDTGTPVAMNQGALGGKEVVSIAVGGGHSLALCADGTLTAWGAGSDGQVGSTEPANQSGGYPLPAVVSRTGVLGGKTIQSIAAGSYHSLALCTDGTLAAWGDNYYSQLGNGTTTDATVPGVVTASGVLAGKTVTAIAAGFQHSLALCSDGTLTAWGYNYDGQLGDGTTTSRTAPVLVLNGERRTGEGIAKLIGGLSSDSMVVTATPPPPVAETLAATGGGDTTATINGRVSAAGVTAAVSFEFGLTTAYGSSVAAVPATVSGSADTAVSATLANLRPGTAYHYRVLASGPGGVTTGADQTLTTTDVAKLVSLTVDGAAALAPAFSAEVAHYETTVANATTSVTVTPVAAAAAATVKVNGGDVASGSASGPLALAAGSNTIMIAVTAAGETRTYEVVVTRLPAVMVLASAVAVPAIAAGFSVGGLPVELSLGFAPPVGTQLTLLKNTGAGLIQGTFSNLAQWQAVALSYNNIQYPFVANYFGGTGNDLVLEWAGRRLLAWGVNANGRLGDGTTVARTMPTAVANGALAGKWIVRSVAGGTHNLALTADGTLAAWGYNASGQLGMGDTVDQNVPARVDMSGVLAGKIPVALAAGSSHNLVLCSDGTLVAWGLNDKGQLGDGTTTNRSTPVRVEQAGVLAGKSVVAIACGGNHCLVWCGDGTLAAWGDNSNGQLGDGTVTNRTTPVKVNQAGVLSNRSVAAIASGESFNLVMCTDGNMAAWGDNPYGQLGNGSILDATAPTLVDRSGVLAGKTVTAVACGGAHSMALCSDGTLAAWGSTMSGQLGNGTLYDYTGKWLPVLVTRTGVLSGKTVAAIAGGNSHSLAICSDGTLTAWGNNDNGELGNTTTNPIATPVLVTTTALRAGERFVLAAGGTNHSLAAVAQPVPPVVETLAAAELKDTSATLNGRVNGNNTTTAGAFEYGLTTAYGSTVAATPASVSGTTSTAVSAPVSGLRSGSIYHFRCVGTAAGRVVYGNDQMFTTTSLASLAGLTPSVAVLSPTFGPETTRYDVTLAGAELALTPVTVDAAATVTVNGAAVASGTASPAIALNPGSNTINVVVSGAGGNTQTYQVIATRLPALMTFASATTVPATAGGFAVAGLTADFTLGYTPAAGTLLTVLKNTGNLPIQGRFTNLTQGQVLRLACGGIEYPFVVNYQGGDGNDLVLEWGLNRLVGWGYNQGGEIGDGTTTSRSVPTAMLEGVLAGRLVSRIVAGGSHGLALCADGTLAAWGGNSYGQLGDGTNSNAYLPVLVDRSGVLGGQEIVGLWAGRVHSVALLADGSLVAWGENTSGQLGDGSTTNRNVPVRVKMDGVLAGKTVKAASCGATHTLVLCTDGTLAAWGDNGYGTLGNGGTTASAVPVAVNRTGVLAGKTVTAIAAGYYFSLAACADGTVTAWGYNTFGQLGNGSTSNSPVPVLVTRTGVLSGRTVTAVAAGESFSLALCADGTLAAWGSNSDGQLGNGTTTSSSAPAMVTRTGVLTGKTVTAVSAGQSNALAFCADGAVVTWGNNYSGVLGDNSTTSRSAPVLVNTSGLGPSERFSAAQVWGVRAMAMVGILPPPVPETLAATAVTGTAASLAGRVGPSGNTVTVAFEYGLSTGYGSTVVAVPATVSGTAVVNVSAALTGLLPAATYHYRVVVTRSGKLFYGADASFTTRDAATLASLAVDSGRLFPGFVASQTSYHVTVPNATAGIALTPVTTHPAATLRINGQTVASGAASETLPLTVGGNSINVVVTGEDGAALTYQVTVTRLPAAFAFASASTIPVTAGALTAAGDATVSLGFAPVPGTMLTVVNNTGGGAIQGRFANLAQWQTITLSFGGIDYPFVVNYYGGTGNDLVLEWANRRLLAWGANYSGNLGDGTTANRAVPAPVLPGVLAGKTMVRVAAGGYHNLALASDGTLVAWGSNSDGQLGDNSTTDRAIPVAVDTSGVLAGKTIIGLVAYGRHSVAICDDGTVATWGGNASGQLGDGTTTNRLKPVWVDRSGVLAGKQVVAVAGNGSHCLALCADGTLVAWGYNGFGQLGDGTSVTGLSPVRVNQAGILAGKVITNIAAGANHSLVLCADATVVTWGYNVFGNLADGTTSSTGRFVPAAVVSSGVLAGKTVIGLSSCADTCLVRCADGTLASWGFGQNGELGNGQLADAQTTPVLVTRTGVLSGKTPVVMASGWGHHLVGCSDGTLVAWGYNSSGQLGDNSATNRLTPVLVPSSALRPGERIAAVGAGSGHSLVWVSSPPPPTLTTQPATEVTDTSAMLNGQVMANGTATTVAFEYGLTTAYGTRTAATPGTVTGTTPTAVSAVIGGLLSGTTYHCRAIAAGAGGDVAGPDQVLTTTTQAALAGLLIAPGLLQPAFEANRTLYQATVANPTASVALTPVTTDAAAVVTVNGTVVASGAASDPIALAEGANPIALEVNGAGGQTRTYQVVVTRLPAAFDFATAATVPVTAAAVALDDWNAAFSLGFAPAPGTQLMVLKNTGTAPIQGRFANLAQWQTVNLSFDGLTYPFLVNYYGGTGNDLVLEWANRRLVGWGGNLYGNLGDDTTDNRGVPVALGLGALASRTVARVAVGTSHTLALCTDGRIAAWGLNGVGSLGDGTNINRNLPGLVDASGVLAGKKVVAVAAGYYDSLALCEDGTLAAWGYNESGQLGDGTLNNRFLPVRVVQSGVLAGKTITAMACAESHTVVLCADGTLAAWGRNSEGQLGNGSKVSSSVPVLVKTDGVLAGRQIVAIGSTWALCADGASAVWGGTTTVPVLKSPTGVLVGRTVDTVVSSSRHTLALCTDGSLVAWGDNQYGQLGVASATGDPVLVDRSGTLAGKTITGIAAGGRNSYALCADGTLAAWGNGNDGRLGDGSSPYSRYRPGPVATGVLRTGEVFAAVMAGEYPAFALVASALKPALETLAATELADATANVNGRVNPSGNAATVAFEYGLTDSYGATTPAIPDTLSGTTPVPVAAALVGLRAGATYHFRVIASGPGGTAVGPDRTFTTTASATLAQLRVSAGTLAPAFEPDIDSYHVTLPGSVAALTLTASPAHPAAVLEVNGDPLAAGVASPPIPLGTGTTRVTIQVTGEGGEERTYQISATRLPAVLAFGSPATVPAVASGFSLAGLAVALRLDHAPVPGAALTVLDNTGPEPIAGRFTNLADGQTVQLPYGGVIYPFVADYYGGTGNELVLRWANSRLFAWGGNYNGELGDGTATSSLLPTPVDMGGELAAKTVLTGGGGASHSVVLCTDGTLVSWGYNQSGQLGVGTTSSANPTPLRVTQDGVLAGKRVIDLAVGGYHSLVLCADGTIHTWGASSYGQLGNGSTYQANVPVAVLQQTGAMAGRKVTAIAAGGSHCLALCEDGTLFAWGYNVYGQLGNGGTTNGKYPAAVSQTGVLAGRRITAIAAGSVSSYALCADGALVAWGRNNYGQLGDNSLVDRTTPVLVDATGVLRDRTVVAFSAGEGHCQALCADGSLVAWGYNNASQLGDGTTTNRQAPVLVQAAGVLAAKTLQAAVAGTGRSYGIAADGTAAVWGSSTLGNGTSSSSNVPVALASSKFPAGSRVAEFMPVAASSFSLALVAVPPPPAAFTLAATEIADTGATLRGEVNPLGLSAAVYFEYGPTTAYGCTASVMPASVAGSGLIPVSAVLDGLALGATYHCRVVASGPNGRTSGEDRVFTTTAQGTLASLTLHDAALSPAFATTQTRYLATVPFGTDFVTVTPVAPRADATVLVNGTALASGATSAPIPLVLGDNPITVALAGVSPATIYQVTVVRLPATFTFDSPSTLPLSVGGLAATGHAAAIALNFPPSPGTSLMLVENTGTGPLSGAFANLAHGQRVDLRFGDTIYPFVADYFGGTGNDLVLRWANTRLFAWGRGGTGQLGDGSVVSKSAAVPVISSGALAGKTLLASAAGTDHSLALCGDGTLLAWGGNQSGQLGTGVAGPVAVAVPMAVNQSGVLAGKMPALIACGNGYNLVLCTDGGLAAWGANGSGQLGINLSASYTAVPGWVDRSGVLADKRITAIAAGARHCLALCQDGTLVAWGENDLGQVGDGTNMDRRVPVLVDCSTALAGKTVIAIAAGGSHSLAYCSDGTLAAWGDNSKAQLGDNTTIARNLPVRIRTGALLGKTVQVLAAGSLHSLALCTDGTLAAWGNNESGELGDGATTQRRVPTLVDQTGVLAGRTVTQIHVGMSHSLALCADGVVAGWGDDGYGQLTTVGDALSPVEMSRGSLLAGDRVTALACFYHNLVLAASPVPPITATLAATGILDTGGTLNGSVVPNGNSNVSIGFEYGLTTDYGYSIPGNPAAVDAGAAVATSAVISGLTPGVTYHFRCVASADCGVTLGEDFTFTTTTFATLAGLRLSHGGFSPAFSGVCNDYQVTVPFGAAQLVLTPTLTHASAAVTVDGVATASGMPSAPLGLTVGQRVIPVVVTAADGLNIRTYTVTVTRLPETFVLNSPDTPPFQADEFTLSGELPAVVLGFVPQPGSILTLLKNAGTAPLRGRFSDLPQGAKVALACGGNTYQFVASYCGGGGNDLVLEWANRRVLAWGDNYQSKLGIGGTVDAPAPVPVTMTGVLAGKTVIATAMGYDSALALCADGTLAAWGDNTYGQLGDGSSSMVSSSALPVLVDSAGVLAGKLVVRIAVGGRQNLALCDDGTLVAWGANVSGQLGDGTMTNRALPVRVNQTGVLAGKRITAIGAGYDYSLALCADGTLVAWGSNFSGQLGVGDFSNRSLPVQVDLTAAAGQPVVSFAACATHILALTADGTLLAWGNDSNGQVGDGRTSVSQTKAIVVNRAGALAGKTITRVYPGYRSSLVGCADGSLAGWGLNSSGQLGTGTTTSSVLVPVLVERTGGLAGKTVLGAAGGETHTVAWCDDFSVAGWGTNSQGQTGTRQTSNLSPAAVDLSGLITGERVIRVSSNYLSNLAISDLPLPVATSLATTAVTGTSATVHGTVNAWQNAVNVSFEYGLDETYGSTATATPAEITGKTDTPVSAALAGLRPGTSYHCRVVATTYGGTIRGADMTFTTLSDNALLAGLGHDGGVIAPEFEKQRLDYFSAVPFETAVVTVSAVVDHPRATVAINGVAANGAAVKVPVALAVGNNLVSLVVTAEDGVTVLSYTLVVNRLPQAFVFNSASDVPLTSEGFAAGGHPVRLVLGFAPAPGTVLTMVNNSGRGFIYGRFGNLAQGQRVTLTYNAKHYDFVANYHGGTGNDLVLQWANTQLLAWGGNGFGQLGDDTTEQRLIPTPVSTAAVLADTTVLAVAGGYLHSLALCADGTLAAWGYNVHGQLGNNGTANSSVPVALDQTGALAGKAVVAIAAGPFHNLALCEDGTIVSWGYNNHGQLGDGTRLTRRAPVVVPRLGALANMQVVAVAAGAYQSFALGADGTVAAWGYNDEGELGDGSTAGSLLPVAVDRGGALAGKRVASLAAGQYHTLALCTDATLVSWGYNNTGQLGNNSTTAVASPVAIGGHGALAGRTPVAISAGGYHNLAWCADGTLVAWGSNNHGQVGGAGAARSAVPVAVDLTGLAAADGIAALATGGNHSLLRLADGRLVGWGENASGQLGDGSMLSRAIPAEVTAVTGRIMVVASGVAARHNLALQAMPMAREGTLGAVAAHLTGVDLIGYAFQLDPLRPGVAQVPAGRLIDGNYEIRFTQPATVDDVVYGAEWSATLQPGCWLELPDTGSGSEHRFAIPLTGAAQGFMRLKVSVKAR